MYELYITRKHFLSFNNGMMMMSTHFPLFTKELKPVKLIQEASDIANCQCIWTTLCTIFVLSGLSFFAKTVVGKLMIYSKYGIGE